MAMRQGALATMLAVLPGIALAGDRVAVIVGNQDYEVITDLGNARADATRMAALLGDLGFQVFDGYDLDRQGFEDLLRRSILNADDGSEIVFFYAGHGIQIGRRNYLLPVDVAFETVYDLPVESVTLDRVIDVLSARGQVHVSIIDACRDNPFPDKMLAGNLDASLFETKTGFDVFQTPLNALVAFSTAPGMVAYDGQGAENSPYTSAILETVSATPEADVLSVFSQVRGLVYAATDGKQVPWESSTLVTPFRFYEEPESALQFVTLDAPETPLPAAVTLSLPYGREIPLEGALAAALNLETVQFTLAEAPGNGDIRAQVYQPLLSERRSDVRAMALADRFTAAVAQTGGAVSVEVTLDMEVNGCDLAAGDALDPGGVGFYRLPNEIEVAQALAQCRAAVEAFPDTPRFAYQLGRAQQAAGQFDAAFASFAGAAEAGHVRAMNATALMLTTDKIDRDVADIPLDEPRAAALLTRAIAAGDPYAMHSRGLRLLRDGPTASEREEGFDLLDRAAELGHTFSMNELGVYFLTRDSDHYLPERGMRYLEASAARNDIYGYHNLGFVALYGLRDGTPDPAAAYAHFERAARGGHPNSPATLGRMIVRGEAGGRPRSEALDWYDIGLARGDGWGGVNGAVLILNGDVSGPSRPEALVRAAKALHLSNGDAVAAARKLLADQPRGDLARALQVLLRDLGQNVSVDGAIGPQTRAALARLATATGLPAPPNTPQAQLETMAKVYWAQNPTRPDLF